MSHNNQLLNLHQLQNRKKRNPRLAAYLLLLPKFTRLSKDVELYKLLVKHYHMSPSELRRRTNQLALLDEIYNKHEHLYKTRKVCAENATPPARTRISGIRAENLGDLRFVD